MFNSRGLLYVAGLALAVAGCVEAPAVPIAASASAQPVELPNCVAHPPLVIDSTYLVFFDAHRADLSQRARRILGEFADRWHRQHGQFLLLVAHTDAAEVGPHDRGPAVRRGGAVADYLAAAGIPRWLISVHDVGATDPLVPTAAGVAEAQNREVYLRPVFGWSDEAVQRKAECRAWIVAHCFTPTPDGLAGRGVCEAALNVLAPL